MIEKNVFTDNISETEKKYLKGGETRAMKNMKKKAVAVLSTTALLASLASPVFAAADYRIGNLVTVSENAEKVDLAPLTFKEDSDFADELQAGGSFTVTFPEGVSVENTDTQNGSVTDFVYVTDATGKEIPGVQVEILGGRTVNVTLPASGFGNTTVESVKITPKVTLDGFSGESVDVEVQDFGAGVRSGKYTLAKVAKGATTAVALNTKTIGETGGQLGTIRIEENSVGTLAAGDKITLQLPKGITWATGTKVDFLGGLAGATIDPLSLGDEKLVITVKSVPGKNQRGVIQITPTVNVDEDEAEFGDIVVDIYGDVSDAQVKVGTYSDYSVVVEAAGDPKTRISGRFDSSKPTSEALQTLVIREKVAGSFINRKTTVTLPDDVKIVGVKIEGSDLNTATGTFTYDSTSKTFKNGNTVLNDFDINDNEVEFNAAKIDAGNGKTELKLTFYVSIKAGFSGDIVAKVSGGGVEGEAVLGKAVAPLTVTTNPTDIRIGVRDQAIGDIVLAETVDESLSVNDWVYVDLEDTTWSNKPKVEVIEGDLEIKSDSVTVDGARLKFQIKSESAKPSKIKISGGKVDLWRSVPEGDLKVKVSGTFIKNGGSDDQVKFEQNDLGKFTVAKILTSTTKLVFTIGSKDYTVNNETKSFDVAPFIDYATSRTYLPVRAVADALGASIYYDNATKTVTIVKDGKAVTYKNGGNSVNIAGTNVPVKVINKEGYTFLPFRLLAEALGAKVEWDATTRQVIVTQE